MYIKKKVNLFNEEYPNISSFIDYVKLNFDYLNFDNIIISDKINSIYQELLLFLLKRLMILLIQQELFNKEQKQWVIHFYYQ